MAFEKLKEEVRQANLDIVEHGLVELTWGNVSAADAEAGVMAIKPSGISYKMLSADDIVVLSIDDGKVLEGDLRPSSDTPTHLHLYREFRDIGAIVHTHSRHAVSWAQAEREIDCFGTTHADHFRGTIPVTRRLQAREIQRDYERNTGVVIVKRFRETGIDPQEMPAVLVACHGPFVWGKNTKAAVENAIVLESIAYMALQTLVLKPGANSIDEELLKKHFLRKHGAEAYYGQDPC